MESMCDIGIGTSKKIAVSLREMDRDTNSTLSTRGMWKKILPISPANPIFQFSPPPSFHLLLLFLPPNFSLLHANRQLDILFFSLPSYFIFHALSWGPNILLPNMWSIHVANVNVRTRRMRNCLPGQNQCSFWISAWWKDIWGRKAVEEICFCVLGRNLVLRVPFLCIIAISFP